MRRRLRALLPLFLLYLSADSARSLTEIISTSERGAWAGVAVTVTYTWCLWASLSTWCGVPVFTFLHTQKAST